MVQTSSISTQTAQWVDVCNLSDIQPNTGVCALVGEEQIAVFRIGNTEEIYALSNYEPFSKAYVLSRGIIGDRQGKLKVASPIYKQNFDLQTGECLDNPSVSVATYPTQVIDGVVQVQVIS